MEYIADADLTAELKAALLSHGAALVGFADLRGISEDACYGFPRGIVIGMPLDKDVLRGISDGPTQAYRDNYDRLNESLDAAGEFAEQWLVERGYHARAQTREAVGSYEPDLVTRLPHKTVATRAGVGWIGKCALLVTPEYGSGLRLSSVLTDAPLTCGTPVEQSRCGDCSVCRTICPANAVSGKSWHVGLARGDFWNARACKETARARSLENLGVDMTICGLCILQCPWTRKYLNG